MRFIEITIRNGFAEKRIQFSKDSNLIHSQNNSVGKTTFLRALLYAMGYPIPDTRGLKLKNMEFWLVLETQRGQYVLHRQNAAISINDGVSTNIYSLPTDLPEVLEMITGCDNPNILNNLLGAFYLDQEKGWTLLNRGKVIGGISFNIDLLVQGLSGVDCSDDLARQDAIKHELKKYNYMLSVSDYQKSLIATGEDLELNTPDEETKIRIEVCKTKKASLEREYNQITEILKQNTEFGKYISKMKLKVLSANGEEIPVTEHTLVGFDDNSTYLAVRREILASEIGKINKKIEGYEKQKKKQNGIFDIRTSIQEFDSNIQNIHVDPIAVKGIINQLNKEMKALSNKIYTLTRQDFQLIDELHYLVKSYAMELGVDGSYVSARRDYLFTRDLKSLSGAILHKLVFSFRLAYIRTIRERAGIILPLILDSPSGREVQLSTVGDMLKLFQRDFPDHQLVVASIYDFEMKNKNLIEFQRRLFD